MDKLFEQIRALKNCIDKINMDTNKKDTLLEKLHQLMQEADDCKRQKEVLVNALESKQTQCDFYEASLDALPNPIFLKNAKGQFVYFNREYQNYFHMEREIYLNKTVLDLEFLPEEERIKYQNEDLNLIETSQVKHYETQFELPDGEVGQSLYWSHGFEVKKSGEKGLVGEIVDISIQKKMQDEINRNSMKLEEANRSIERMMKEDFLTGLLNRRVIDEVMLQLQDMLQNNRTSISVLMADLDDFKKVNDTYGHAYGDEVLVKFAGILKSCNRCEDLVIRFGGEEFLVVLFDTKEEGAREVAERVRRLTEDILMLPNGKTNTVSIGVTEIGHGEGFQEALERVDNALYEAKQNGKNKVIVKAKES